MQKLNISGILGILTFTLTACGGGGGGSSSAPSTPVTTSTQDTKNEIPEVINTPAVAPAAQVQRNLSLFNNKNEGLKVLLSPDAANSNSLNNPVYSVSRQKDNLLTLTYTFGTHQYITATYNTLTKQLIDLRLRENDTDISCNLSPRNNCKNISVMYNERTGNSILSFNNQQFDASKYQETTSAPYYEEIPYKITLHGTVKGNINQKPLSFENLEQNFSGQIKVNNQVMEISRAYMRDSQLAVHFKNGESLYLMTGNSGGFLNGYYTDQEDFSSSAEGHLSKLNDDRVKISITNADFFSDTGSLSKTVNGEITLINSIADFDAESIDRSLSTNHVYVTDINNRKIQYFISFSGANDTFRPVTANIVTQDQRPVSIHMEVHGVSGDTAREYSCVLEKCKNVAISKDGTYLKLDATPLISVSDPTKSIKVSAKIRTNLR